MRTVDQRFWEKVNKQDGDDSCWLWTAAKFLSGYGHFYVGNGVFTAAHRYSMGVHLGQPIPKTLRVLHRCDVRACVRPSHLFVGTQRDNILDMIAKGRGNLQAGAQRGERNPRAKINVQDVAQIRQMAASGIRQKDIGELKGLTQGVISKIVRRTIWQDVP